MSPEQSSETAGHEHNNSAGSFEGMQGQAEPASPENSRGALSQAQRRMLALQQTAGNRAVNRRLVQRQSAHPPQAQQPAAPAAATAPTAAPPAPAAPGTPGTQMVYSINFRFPGGAPITFQNLSRDDAIHQTQYIATTVDNFITSWHESHMRSINQNIDSWFTAAVSDWVGRREMPSIAIWEPAEDMLARARTNIRRGNIREALEGLQEAIRLANNANHQLDAYREGSIRGAERVMVALEFTEGAGAVAATVLTAGTASGFWATAGVVSLTAGTYGMAANEAGQFSGIALGTQQTFDVMAMFRRGARDAILGFVGAITGGALNAGLNRVATRYFLSHPEILVRIAAATGQNGPRLVQFLTTSGQRYFAEFISSIPTTVITTAVSNVVTRLIGDASDIRQLNRIEEEGFLHQVWEQLLQGGLMSLLFAFMTHSALRSEASLRGRTMPAGTAAPRQQLALPEPAQAGSASSTSSSTGPVEALAPTVEVHQAASGEQAGIAAPSVPTPAAPRPPEEVLAAPTTPPQEVTGTGNPPATTGQPGESTAAPVSERTTPPGEESPAEIGQARTLVGGRRYTSLSRQQAQLVLECAVQRHLLGALERQFRGMPAWHEFDPRTAEGYIHTREILQHTQNRVTELEGQLGDPTLVARVRSYAGRNNPLTAEDYQNDFRRLTGNTGPAPEGGFITEGGYIVTFREGPAINTPQEFTGAVSSPEALAPTGAMPQAAVLPRTRESTQSGTAIPLTRESTQIGAASQAGGPAAAGSPPVESAQAVAGEGTAAALPPEVQPPQVEPISGLNRTQAEEALAYQRLGMNAARPSGYSAGHVELIMDWETYVASYQQTAGHGAMPPPYGFAGRDGHITLFLPRRGQLMGAGEALPPLPPSMGGVSTGTTAGSEANLGAGESAVPPTRSEALAPTLPAQAAAGAPPNSYGGENPVSGQTLTGIGRAGESSGLVNASLPRAEVPTSRQTLIGNGPSAGQAGATNPSASSPGEVSPTGMETMGEQARNAQGGEVTAAPRRKRLPAEGKPLPGLEIAIHTLPFPESKPS